MSADVFESMKDVLLTQFKVEPEKIAPEARLQDLGLDSLSLVEFVFSLEDRFGLRIPEERLDPRQVELTLEDVRAAVESALASAGADAAAAPR